VFRLLALFGAILTGAEALPVVPLQFTPDQIALSLRTTKPPMPPADCHALNAFECSLENPTPVRDISIRWVQLDDDSELEAIIVASMEAEWDRFAYVFDKNRTWNLIGAIPCYRRCPGLEFVRVGYLTTDSPIFVILRRDLGGPDHEILAYSGYHLRGGRLWPAFEFEPEFNSDTRQRTLHINRHENRLILRATGTAKLTCSVLRWDAKTFRFVDVPSETKSLCAQQIGTPIDRY
jgi:hypothetical protein